MPGLLEYLDNKSENNRIKSDIRKEFCPVCGQQLIETHCAKCERDKKENLWDWSQPM